MGEFGRELSSLADSCLFTRQNDLRGSETGEFDSSTESCLSPFARLSFVPCVAALLNEFEWIVDFSFSVSILVCAPIFSHFSNRWLFRPSSLWVSSSSKLRPLPLSWKMKSLGKC